jgi:hypothetical protein
VTSNKFGGSGENRTLIAGLQDQHSTVELQTLNSLTKYTASLRSWLSKTPRTHVAYCHHLLHLLVESNHLKLAYQTSALPSGTACMGPRRGLKPRSQAYKTCASSISPPTTDRLTNGARSGSPTRLCSLEDCHLKRSVNPAQTNYMVRMAGFDPAAPRARGVCSSRLSYILM